MSKKDQTLPLQRDLRNSPVVANCNMNRLRQLRGGNGYAVELGFDVLDRLIEIAKRQPDSPVRWLDLCCGSGRALFEAAGLLDEFDCCVSIVGLDLVDMFWRSPATKMPEVSGRVQLQLKAVALESFDPAGSWDLITCVHGLHYLADKIGQMQRYAGHLAENGYLIASFDMRSVGLLPDGMGQRKMMRALRDAGWQYDARHKRLAITGRPKYLLPVEFVGADDQAGPNYTGQPAVQSFYRWKA